MCKEGKESEKFVGGKVDPDLYWRFKQTYTQRKETATEALNHALNLYLEIANEGGGQNG